MQDKIKGLLLIACTAILWSTGGLLIKLVPWNAMTIVGMRALFAALVIEKNTHHFFSRDYSRWSCMSGTTILFVFANKLTTEANAIVLVAIIVYNVVTVRRSRRAELAVQNLQGTPDQYGDLYLEAYEEA